MKLIKSLYHRPWCLYHINKLLKHTGDLPATLAHHNSRMGYHYEQAVGKKLDYKRIRNGNKAV